MPGPSTNLRLTEGSGNDHCNPPFGWCLMREPSDLVTEATHSPPEEYSSDFDHDLDSRKHPFNYATLHAHRSRTAVNSWEDNANGLYTNAPYEVSAEAKSSLRSPVDPFP